MTLPFPCPPPGTIIEVPGGRIIIGDKPITDERIRAWASQVAERIYRRVLASQSVEGGGVAAAGETAAAITTV